MFFSLNYFTVFYVPKGAIVKIGFKYFEID